jgi:hypothetical protein
LRPAKAPRTNGWIAHHHRIFGWDAESIATHSAPPRKDLSTDAPREKPVRDDHLAPEFRLRNHVVHGRVSQACGTVSFVPGGSAP